MVVGKFLSWLRPKLSLMFEVTNACNLHCSFCFVSRTGRMKQESIPLDRYEQILRTYRPIYLHLTGGEVTVHPHFIDLIKVASKYAFRTRISSNGLLIEQYLAALRALPQKPTFGIALDAPNELHDVIRNRKGLFRTILRTLPLLRESGIPHSLHVTIFGKNEIPNLPEGNLHLVEEMLAFCQRYQLNANFQPYTPTQKATRVALGQILLKSKSRYLLNSIPFIKLLINGNWNTCRYNWVMLSINARGNQLPTTFGNCYFCSDCSKCYFSCAWEPTLLASRQSLRTITSLIKPVLSVEFFKSNRNTQDNENNNQSEK